MEWDLSAVCSPRRKSAQKLSTKLLRGTLCIVTDSSSILEHPNVIVNNGKPRGEKEQHYRTLPTCTHLYGSPHSYIHRLSPEARSGDKDDPYTWKERRPGKGKTVLCWITVLEHWRGKRLYLIYELLHKLSCNVIEINFFVQPGNPASYQSLQYIFSRSEHFQFKSLLPGGGDPWGQHIVKCAKYT